jgi:parallel beta-helix repeat protein
MTLAGKTARHTTSLTIPAGVTIRDGSLSTVSGSGQAIILGGDNIRLEDVNLSLGSWAAGVYCDQPYKGLHFRRVKFTSTGAFALSLFDKVLGARIEDCDFSTVQSGIRIRGGVQNVRVIDCNFRDWVTYGIEIRGVSGVGAPSGVKVRGCDWRGARSGDPGTAANAKQPLGMFGADDAIMKSIHIIENTATGSAEAHQSGLTNQGTADQFGMQYVSGFVFAGNISVDGGENGVSITRRCSNGTVANNTVLGNDGHGIQIGRITEAASNITVTGNTSNGNGVDRQGLSSALAGIYVQGSDHVAVESNRCGGNDYGLNWSTCTSFTVRGNNLDGNTVGRYSANGTNTYDSFEDAGSTTP